MSATWGWFAAVPLAFFGVLFAVSSFSSDEPWNGTKIAGVVLGLMAALPLAIAIGVTVT